MQFVYFFCRRSPLPSRNICRKNGLWPIQITHDRFRFALYSCRISKAGPKYRPAEPIPSSISGAFDRLPIKMAAI